MIVCRASAVAALGRCDANCCLLCAVLVGQLVVEHGQLGELGPRKLNALVMRALNLEGSDRLHRVSKAI